MKTFLRLVALAIVVLACAASAHARTWYVNPGGTGDVTTIKAALDSAVYWDTVLVACGAYEADYMFMGPGIVLLSETGNPGCVTISGQFGDSSILDCLADSVTRIEGFTMNAGFGSDWGALRIVGPGVVENCNFGGFSYGGAGGVRATDATFVNCVISGRTFCNGGGMIGNGVTLIKCSVYGEATDGDGGGFYGSAVLIDSCTISGTAEFGGGAMSGSAATITNTVFRNSKTDYGNGGAIEGRATYMADCTFTGNKTADPGHIHSDSPDGGAIAGGAGLMERCSFIGNQSPFGKGGAIRGGVGTVRDCIFIGNSADYGGALFIGSSSISGSYFRGNVAWIEHGAIRMAGGSINGSTFYGNKAHGYDSPAAGKGGSVTATADVIITQSIISFGGSTAVPVYCDNGAAVTIECSNVYGNVGGDYVGCIAGQLGVNGNISANPMFANASAGDFSLLPGSPCLPENNGCGLMGAGSIVCGDYFATQSPADQVLPAYSTVEYIVLDNFWVRNDYCDPHGFAYAVWSDGPATLVDNGDPASLSGITPLLEPGEVFTPPAAALEVPAIRHDTDQLVWYRVTSLTNPDDVHLNSTRIEYTAPVPVWISRVEARAIGTGVELRWKTASEEPIAGIRVYRSEESQQDLIPLTAGELLPPDTDSYTDRDVQPGTSYRYVIGVVLDDGSETRSHEVSIKARPLELTLGQNHPNPFNPTTTIPILIPELGRVQLKVYDVRGALVKTLFDGVLPAGYRQLTWDGTDNRGSGVGSGVYFYRLVAGKKSLTKRMTLLK